MSKSKDCTLRDESFPTMKNTPGLVDATQYLLWDQTVEDRSGAIQMHENHCQIAEAIKRCHPEAEQVWVKASRIAIRFKNGHTLRWVVPTQLRSKIRAFDQGGRISDGSYYALPISPSIKLDKLAELNAETKRAYKEGRKSRRGKNETKARATR